MSGDVLGNNPQEVRSFGNTPIQVTRMDPSHKPLGINVEEEVLDKIRLQLDAGETPEILKGNYSKIQIGLTNDSGYSINHPFFDPYTLVESYMSSRPKLKNEYRFNGLWKPDKSNSD